MRFLITRADIAGRPGDVRIANQHIAAVAPSLRPAPDEDVIDAAGGALLPGLHDHHLHLHAMAAAKASVNCGPPQVTDAAGLSRVLRAADSSLAPGVRLRGIGYHESVAGPLDRGLLDHLVPARPARIQHRSGALWVLNTAALDQLGLAEPCRTGSPAGVERDAEGRATGRLWRSDALLRAQPEGGFPDLGPVATDLLRVGITGVTDATPDLDMRAVGDVCAAHADGRLPQRVMLLGAPGKTSRDGVEIGPRKLLLPDHDLPPFDELRLAIAQAHAEGRAVAVHCVTRVSLLLTLAAIEAAGRHPGDRIEHAAVVPPEARTMLARQQLAVVTQPSFVVDRGDSYLREVAPADHDLLYPYASLCGAGVKVAPSSDAPFGDADPWRSIAAASRRRTAGGEPLGEAERVTAAVALDGYLSPAADPGGPPRRLVAGARSDLCLLHLPLREALRAPSRDHVRLTICGERVEPTG